MHNACGRLMFGNIYPPAAVPCPRCHQQPNVVTYVYFNTVALFCKRCEYAWQVEESAYPELATLVRQRDTAKDH